MKFAVRIVVVALLATLFVAPTFAQKSEQPKKKGRQSQSSLFSFTVQRAVPGINAVVTLSKKQRQEIVKLHKETMGSESLAELRKKSSGENSSNQDKRAVRKAVQEAQAKLSEKSNDIVGKKQTAFIAKINTVAKEVQSSVRSEYRQKLRDARGDEEAAKSLQKEINAETTVLLSKKIASMLSDEQKEAVAAAAKREAKRGRAKRREKKKDEAAA
jgi:hypothetical protein